MVSGQEGVALDVLHTPPWGQRYLHLAQHIAGWSKDPSTKAGCVIVGDRHRIVSLGYNGFPRGIVDMRSRYEDRATKYRYTSHAERNALDNADGSVVGCEIYCTHYPCIECSKSIIQRGIKDVFYGPMSTEFMDRWREDISLSMSMFLEAGVYARLLVEDEPPL